MDGALTRQPGRARRSRLSAAVASGLALAILAALLTWLVTGRASGGGSAERVSGAGSAVAFEAETGMRVIRVVVAAGGGVVDLRYRVLDPDKAAVVHDEQPVLVDEKTGGVLDEYFHGHAGSGGTLRVGGTYYMLYANSSGLLQPGDRATLRVGDARLQHIVVR